MIIVPGSAFIPKAAGDPYWDNVVLLMHMDDHVEYHSSGFTSSIWHATKELACSLGAQEAYAGTKYGRHNPITNSCDVFNDALFTSYFYTWVGYGERPYFVDETGKTITRFGDATISTTQSKFGGASAYFSGVTNDYLRTPTSGDFQFDLGTAYTIEYYIYLPSAINSKILLGNSRSPWIWHRQATQTSVGLYLHGSEPTGTTIANTWHHIALVFDGTNAKRYIDGTYVDTNAQAPNPGDDFFSIGGGAPADGGVVGPECYIDELRITKGVARYTADFTPPTTPFPDS